MVTRLLGDSAFVIELEGGASRAVEISRRLMRLGLPGVVEVQPAFSAITVHCDPLRVEDWSRLAAEVEAIAAGVATGAPAGKLVEIPVVYGGEHGPDLAEIAARAGMSADAFAEGHGEATYVATAVGFVPGFAYLEGLPEALHSPRRASPRVRVPEGSVAIGGRYTGVYPQATPAGWNIIGRTSLRLFDVAWPEPAAIAPGDRVRFRRTAATVGGR